MIGRAKGKIAMPTWGVAQTADIATRNHELELERRVSAYIGQMYVLWLAVNDEPSAKSDRAYLEQNTIALLSGPNGPIDTPDRDWLGSYSPHETIRHCGLWNIDHAQSTYDPRFLDVFERYVEITHGMGTNSGI